MKWSSGTKIHNWASERRAGSGSLLSFVGEGSFILDEEGT
jgi:hypothetical protein